MPLLALLACTAPSTAPTATPIGWCESDVRYEYAPDEAFHTFPDDWWTVADTATHTGLRVSMPPDAPAFSTFPPEYANLLEDLGTLDGFGLSPPVMLQFSSAPPLDGLEIVLLVEADGTWAPRDVTVESLEYGRTLAITPWQPLPPASRVVVAVRSDPAAPDCVSPSPTLRALVDPASTEPLGARYAEGLAALGWAPEEVGAMVVYTTQSAEDVDAAVATIVASSTVTLDAPATCTDEGAWRDCRGTFTVSDFRGDDRIVPDGEVAVRSTYALPAAIWLPPSGTTGPYPVTLCGHGLGGSKNQCEFLAALAAPLGVAVLAVDAQEHGDHPARTAGDDDLEQIMGLFGFTLTPPSLDALVMRDNFRASAWDKLQLVRAVELGVDVDGDGAIDLDSTNVQYTGASLGGIMGPEALAWSGLAGGLLAVPGGGLMNLVLDSQTFGIIATAMKPDDWDDDELARAVPLVQTVIDAGDPLVHAAAITRRRATAEGPDVVLMMAFGDTIVPNSSTAALAQAFGVAGVGEELLAVPGVTFTAGPLAGNLADGATGVMLQLDETQPYEGAAWEPADHSTLHESVQAAGVMEGFLLDVLAGETPTVADPYTR